MERTLLKRAMRGDLKAREAMTIAPQSARVCIKQGWVRRVRHHLVLTGKGRLAMDRPDGTP